MRTIFAALLLMTVPARAQQTEATVQPHAAASGLGFSKHDSNQPIDVQANQFKADLGSKVGTYSGNVVVTQGDMKMRSDTVRIEEVQDKPNKVYAHGNVVINAPNGTGTGDDGLYDLVAKTITLTGKVVLTKDKNVMRGTRLVMDLNTNLANLTAAGMPGGRVRAILVPGQKSGGGDGTKKPSSGGGK